jgi:hypothetical protein
MKVIYLRDGANASIEDGVFRFTGASGTEFLNVRRTTPMVPPTHVLDIKPDTIFKIHTGIAVKYDDPGMPDVRATKAYWRNHGLRVERVDAEEVSPGVSELVVYITAMNSFSLNPRDLMFESFVLATRGDLEIFTGDLPTRANGFVPIPKRQVMDSSVKKGPEAGKQAAELSDEEKRKKFGEFLASEDSTPGQEVVHGAPPVDLLKHSGVRADTGTEAKVVRRGGVTALSDSGGPNHPGG